MRACPWTAARSGRPGRRPSVRIRPSPIGWPTGIARIDPGWRRARPTAAAQEPPPRARLRHAVWASLGLRRHYPLAVAVRLHRRDEPRTFHLFDQTRSAVVADAQMPLYQRNRRAPRAQHNLDRLVVERIGFAVCGLACAVLAACADFGFLEHALQVLRLAHGLEVVDHHGQARSEEHTSELQS